MAKYSNTKAKINEKITTNGAQAVTGIILNDVLQTMVDSLGADYQFGGLVQPGSSFTAGEQPVVFLATTPGTYTNFGGLVVADGEVALLVWSGSAWSKQTPDIATRTEVGQLGQDVISSQEDVSQLKQEVSGAIHGVEAYTNFIQTVNILKGYYVAPSTGELAQYSPFEATEFIGIDEQEEYELVIGGQIYLAYYDENKQYISGDDHVGGYVLTIPANAKYIRVSYYTAINPNPKMILTSVTPILDAGVKLNENADYLALKSKVDYFIENITIEVKPNGGGDYTKLSDAFASITDSSYYKRYTVLFYGDGQEYDTLIDSPYIQGWWGLMVPPFTRLVGVGGKEKNILVRRLQTGDDKDSLINLYQTSGIEGFTLRAEKTRYVVHDDFVSEIELDHLDFQRVVRDMEVEGTNLEFGSAWGAGIRSGINWLFENCKITNNGERQAYSCHNNVGFINTTTQRFRNCRFFGLGDVGGISFGSLNIDANGINNIVILEGNQLKYLTLREESAAHYGSGILFKVSGFANTIKNGDSGIAIIHTDQEDYSTNVDLI